MRKMMAGAALALSLFPGACSAENESPPAPEWDVIESSFEDAIDYWTEKGIGVRAVGLAFLGGDDQYDCGDTSLSAEFERPFYCWRTDDVVFPQAFFERDEGEDDVELVETVHHETGHAVQDALGIGEQRENRILLEIQAQCLAGVSVEATRPELVPEIIRRLRNTGFTDYGSGEDLAYHFSNGANGEDCLDMTADLVQSNF